MNRYTARVYCDRQGVEVEETVLATTPQTLDDINQLLYQAEEQHGGQCGTKREPCTTKADPLHLIRDVTSNVDHWGWGGYIMAPIRKNWQQSEAVQEEEGEEN